MDDPFIIAGRRFASRLLVGTGKYRDFKLMRAAVEASGADIVTVALRRISLAGENDSITEHLDPKRYTYLPNSAGCRSAEEAVRTLRLAREAGGWSLVKLEVMGDATTLYPDVAETIKAAGILAKDGFKVMAYTNDDPIAARRLEDAGCVAVMPLASPIGSGLGIRNPAAIEAIVKQARVPVLVDAGIGTASDAAIAMELGCDGVLLNTAIAEADDPVRMAEAMKHAVIAGRLAFKAGRMGRRQAEASSPKEGLLQRPQ
jgi:thiazole synthase